MRLDEHPEADVLEQHNQITDQLSEAGLMWEDIELGVPFILIQRHLYSVYDLIDALHNCLRLPLSFICKQNAING